VPTINWTATHRETHRNDGPPWPALDDVAW